MTEFEKYKRMVSLKSESVELASSKDLDKKLKSLLDAQKKLDKINPSLEQLIKDQKEWAGILDMRVKEAEGLLTDFKKQADDLGVSADTAPAYKSLNNEVQNSKSTYLK